MCCQAWSSSNDPRSDPWKSLNRQQCLLDVQLWGNLGKWLIVAPVVAIVIGVHNNGHVYWTKSFQGGSPRRAKPNCLSIMVTNLMSCHCALQSLRQARYFRRLQDSLHVADVLLEILAIANAKWSVSTDPKRFTNTAKPSKAALRTSCNLTKQMLPHMKHSD